MLGFRVDIRAAKQKSRESMRCPPPSDGIVMDVRHAKHMRHCNLSRYHRTLMGFARLNTGTGLSFCLTGRTRLPALCNSPAHLLRKCSLTTQAASQYASQHLTTRIRTRRSSEIALAGRVLHWITHGCFLVQGPISSMQLLGDHTRKALHRHTTDF